MAAMASPFTEYEKRSLLVEIIKASDIPLEALLSIINNAIPELKWPDVVLPAGRTLNACLIAFQELRNNYSSHQFHPSGLEPLSPVTRKRRHSDAEQPSITARTLHPKPAANGDPTTSLQSTVETAHTKRGRPPKAVLEARRKEAAARGVTYPPLKAAALPKSTGVGPLNPIGPALEGTGLVSKPSPVIEGSTDSPSLKKRRGRPPKTEADKSKGQLRQPTPEAVQTPLLSAADKGNPDEAREPQQVVPSVPKDASITMVTSAEVPDSAATTQTQALPNPQQTPSQQSDHS